MAYAIAKWSRTPDTWTHDYQFSVNKTLLSSNEGVFTVEDSTIHSYGTSSPTVEDFQSKGFDVSTVDFTSTFNEKTYHTSSSATLGDGRVFETEMDLSKYDVNTLKIGG